MAEHPNKDSIASDFVQQIMVPRYIITFDNYKHQYETEEEALTSVNRVIRRRKKEHNKNENKYRLADTKKIKFAANFDFVYTRFDYQSRSKQKKKNRLNLKFELLMFETKVLAKTYTDNVSIGPYVYVQEFDDYKRLVIANRRINGKPKLNRGVYLCITSDNTVGLFLDVGRLVTPYDSVDVAANKILQNIHYFLNNGNSYETRILSADKHDVIDPYSDYASKERIFTLLAEFPNKYISSGTHMDVSHPPILETDSPQAKVIMAFLKNNLTPKLFAKRGNNGSKES